MSPDDYNKRLHSLVRHIEHVKDNCRLLADRLGEDDFSKRLIANSYIHDQSKFHGIEWEYLADNTVIYIGKDKEAFDAALAQHVHGNPHHPEYWGGIYEMPKIFIAEMVGDWFARSQEFGTDLREWITEKARDKFKFNCQCKVYKQIKEFVDIMLDKKLD